MHPETKKLIHRMDQEINFLRDELASVPQEREQSMCFLFAAIKRAGGELILDDAEIMDAASSELIITKATLQGRTILRVVKK